MNSFTVRAKISGRDEILLVIPDSEGKEKGYRIIKDGVEFCTLKQNGSMGWEVSGTPLNADELDSISQQIREVSN